MYLVREQKFRLKDFELNTPEIQLPQKGLVTLTGPNGSGKTLFLNYLIGLINSKHLLEKPDLNIGRYDKIGTFFGPSSLLQHLNVEEYFNLLARLFKNKTPDFSDAQNWLANLQLDPLDLKIKIKKFSMGNQKKIGLVGSIIHDPEVIIWDEPFANLDDTAHKLLVNSIQLLKSHKLVIIGTPNELPIRADIALLTDSGSMTIQKT